MVRFNETSFTITIDTGGEPVEEWLCLHDELCRLIRDQHSDLAEAPWTVLCLLAALTPDLSVAQKMTR